MTVEEVGDPRLVATIGVVHSARTDASHTPVQAALNPDEQAELHIHAEYAEALEGLDEFDYVWLLTWLDRGSRDPAAPAPRRQVPYLLTGAPRELGIFATRGPRRPTPIGLSLVRLVAIDGLIITFAGVDVVDGTPVIDLKPWVRPFDQPPGAAPVRCGWFDTVAMEAGSTPASLREGC